MTPETLATQDGPGHSQSQVPGLVISHFREEIRRLPEVQGVGGSTPALTESSALFPTLPHLPPSAP